MQRQSPFKDPYGGRVAPEGQQIVTRGSLDAETTQTGERATAYAENETRNAVGSIAEAVAGIAGAGVADIRARIEGILGGLLANTETLVEHTEAIAELAEIAETASAITPAYVSNLDEMATVPRSSCIEWYQTNNTLARRPLRFKPGAQSVIGTGGYVYYTPLPVDRVGIPDRIRYVSGGDRSWIVDDIADFRLELCVFNPDTWAIEKVTNNGNLRNLGVNEAAELSVPLDLGESNRARPGQLLFIAHQQRAPGAIQSTREIMCAPNPEVLRGDDVLLRFAHYRTGHLSAIPSSVPLESLQGFSDHIPWFSVGMRS
ncbi:minor tail protein [Gordonia phage Huffy]|uniref:Minor tail protein n=1 Tax=Gordonia phage TZGordon TaxID=2744004 RepID=A0A6N0A628_9CAUD|nr:minor tail protein [Gordonia phage TZGordon]AQY55633.1 minor tail protein [Gordonia phage Huffy]QKO02952.1 minor tail protein [Gordonia phage TZGordon]